MSTSFLGPLFHPMGCTKQIFEETKVIRVVKLAFCLPEPFPLDPVKPQLGTTEIQDINFTDHARFKT